MISLDSSASLSIREVPLSHIDDHPLLSCVVVKLFDGIDVLSCLVSNPTKCVHESVHERTRAMIVPPDVEVSDFEPEVDVSVVHLAFEL